MVLSITGGCSCLKASICLITCGLSSLLLYSFPFYYAMIFTILAFCNTLIVCLDLCLQSSSELGQGTVNAHWSRQVRGNCNAATNVTSKSPCGCELAYAIAWRWSSRANYVCNCKHVFADQGLNIFLWRTWLYCHCMIVSQKSANKEWITIDANVLDNTWAML